MPVERISHFTVDYRSSRIHRGALWEWEEELDVVVVTFQSGIGLFEDIHDIALSVVTPVHDFIVEADDEGGIGEDVLDVVWWHAKPRIGFCVGAAGGLEVGRERC